MSNKPQTTKYGVRVRAFMAADELDHLADQVTNQGEADIYRMSAGIIRELALYAPTKKPSVRIVK